MACEAPQSRLKMHRSDFNLAPTRQRSFLCPAGVT